MPAIKKMLHVISLSLLGFTLAVGLIAAAFSLMVTNREVIKSWPADAGIYPKISDQLLSLVQRGDEEGGQGEESLEESLDNSALNQDGLNSAIKTVYTPVYWQSKYEQFINAFYDWLDGTQPQLEFEIAFNDKTDQLARALESELAEQLARYPACPASLSPDDFDPLKANCLPTGLSAEQAASRFTRELTGSDSFLADAVITPDDINLDQEFEDTAPSAFAGLGSLPWILSAVVLIFALISVVTDKSWLHGLRKVGQTLFSVGLVSWIGFFLGNRLAASFDLRPPEGESNVDPDAFNDIAQPLARAVLDDFTRIGMWAALFVVILGVLVWLAAFIWHKTHHHNEAEAIAKKAMAGSPSAKQPKLPPPIKPGDSASQDKP